MVFVTVSAYPTINKTKSSTRGFSLAEVVVAFAIMAILLGSLFAGLNQAVKLTQNSRFEVEANEMMRAQIEHLRSITWTALTQMGTVDANDSNQRIAQFSNRFRDGHPMRQGMTGEVIIRRESANMRSIHLRVMYTDANGRQKESNMWTLITNGGISA
jgi:prepilin-type N-terminal cleavage/methylation domain-containing protein